MTRRMITTTWRGTVSEQRDLLAALQRHCTCAHTQRLRTSVCNGHRMLVEDQRALDGLLFVRRLADRLRREEELASGPLTEPATTAACSALRSSVGSPRTEQLLSPGHAPTKSVREATLNNVPTP